ncbi:MAG: FG-GAP-like repeat-containing protein [Myxococcota bacterium]
MNTRTFLPLPALALALLQGCPNPKPPSEQPPPTEEPPPVEFAHGKQGQGAAFADLDGDGRDDKVVGAPWAQQGDKLGVLLVYPGTEQGFAESAALKLTGEDNHGFAVLRLSDVDGDGHDELAVSALTGNSTETALCGSVTVYRGGKNGEVLTTVAAGRPAAKFGYVMARGDLNADGQADLIVGAPFDTPDSALFQQGSVHVFLAPSFTTRISLAATSANKGLGWAVASGDFDGDGKDDLLLGAAGKILGYRGGTGFAPALDTPDLTVKSVAAGFGRSLAVAGEYIVVGAPAAKVGDARDTGALFVITRGTTPRTVDLDATPTPADLLVTIPGPALFGRLGVALVPAGDVDADGKADFVVGAPGADVETNDMRGRVYLFRGKDLGASTTLASATGFPGTRRFQGYGSFLAVGKNNTLLIGAPRGDGDVGSAYVVDLASGQPVPGGATGGVSGGGEHCHDGQCHGE